MNYISSYTTKCIAKLRKKTIYALVFQACLSPEAILSEDMDTVWNAMYSSQPVNFFFSFAVVTTGALSVEMTIA